MRMLLIVVLVAFVMGTLKAVQETPLPERPDSGLVVGAVRGAPPPWAKLGRSAQLSENEELTEVVLASPLTEALDVRCLRYVHRYYGQVSLVCPGVSQDDMAGALEVEP